MYSTSQCELRSTFPNLRGTNIIRTVTYYTLPSLESPDSSWMTRSQRSRRRDKGLWRLWRSYGDDTECRVPAEFWLAIDCALSAWTRRVRSGHGVHTALAAFLKGTCNPGVPFPGTIKWCLLSHYSIQFLRSFDTYLGPFTP